MPGGLMYTMLKDIARTSTKFTGVLCEICPFMTRRGVALRQGVARGRKEILTFELKVELLP